ncbi:hypothetical protein N311_06936, partial [Apaloderma vittatum]
SVNTKTYFICFSFIQNKETRSKNYNTSLNWWSLRETLGRDSASRLGFNFCCCGGWVGFVLYLFVCLFVGIFLVVCFSSFCLF